MPRLRRYYANALPAMTSAVALVCYSSPRLCGASLGGTFRRGVTGRLPSAERTEST